MDFRAYATSELMTEHAIVFAVSSDKDFLMCFSALTWKCTALQVAFTCWLKERFESIVTPRFECFAEVTKSMQPPNHCGSDRTRLLYSIPCNNNYYNEFRG